MSDIFREVDEDLRRDRAEHLFKKYGGAMIAAAVLVVAGTGGYSFWRHWQAQKKQEQTAALVTAISQSGQGPEKGVDALAAFAGSADPSLAAIAQFNAAALMIRQGKGSDAATVYDGIAGNASVPAQYRDLATLMGVMQRADSGDPAQLTAKLQPLTADTSPWRFSARELTAMLAARAGDTEKARTLYKQLADDQQAPSGVRGRAADLASLYGKG
ncbi:tetratricopeptide repeat protein [Azospirillum sp. 11R-A]|uniref:tetratricopeptide repeat protein n=1 Tax=Azospirillum sp. 11R-A TaxID=3111634 RepID=UPI003C1BC706